MTLNEHQGHSNWYIQLESIIPRTLKENCLYMSESMPMSKSFDNESTYIQFSPLSADWMRSNEHQTTKSQ